ncbi:LAMI_0F16600g1_1 [Lachancea mirantina]|uniref:LAMI_0F16600g1_1 n=1 Tax=Lachancea mirantina TaxID=1230905 RepID=A0A1G4K507_9SACH|nr:LAMI_0F16600g1_1 [Lachancea mirantina]
MAEKNESSSTPLWLKSREEIIAATPPSVWRGKVPNYAEINEKLSVQRQKHFEPNSLEELVSNLVRCFEMEATHKANPADWISVDHNVFVMTVNGGPAVTIKDLVTKGGYNVFIGDQPGYNASESNYEKSEEVFRNALRQGFLWELLDLKTDLPKAYLKWRHWGIKDGEFNGHKGDGSLLEFPGSSVVTLNDKMQIIKLEHEFDAAGIIASLSGKCPMAK